MPRVTRGGAPHQLGELDACPPTMFTPLPYNDARLLAMDEIPRKLYERTGRHWCVRCLKEVSVEEYFRNDFACDACAVAEEGRRLQEGRTV